MEKNKIKKAGLLLLSSMMLSACGGSSDEGNAVSVISVSSCSFTEGDNTLDQNGNVIRVKSHEIGSPVYRVLRTRDAANGTGATIDYMVHEPMGTPKGVFVLITGGAFTANIEGGVDGEAPTKSGGNFVVRSAHRYQAAGYRVITIDQPDDFQTSFATPDAYRTSMGHAVDIASILKRENIEGYNVLISGTSRGTISAAAMNSLVAGIAMSSPLTDGIGIPVGSPNLPISRIERTSHILFHTADACDLTTPVKARELFNALDAAGVDVTGNEVSGGVPGANSKGETNVCGGFDYHGFNGIEFCAVSKETDWADGVMSKLATNNTPVADSQTVSKGNPIILTATDADMDDKLVFAVPYASTTQGGTVSTDSDGNVTYTPPQSSPASSDSFAFSVSDGKGGVSTAVVKIASPG